MPHYSESRLPMCRRYIIKYSLLHSPCKYPWRMFGNKMRWNCIISDANFDGEIGLDWITLMTQCFHQECALLPPTNLGLHVVVACRRSTAPGIFLCVFFYLVWYGDSMTGMMHLLLWSNNHRGFFTCVRYDSPSHMIHSVEPETVLRFLEPATPGIEPGSLAWQASVHIPLHYPAPITSHRS